MTRPLDRNASLPPLGDIDSDAGEFWVTNPFEMPVNGLNLSAYERNRLFLNVDGRRFVDASYASQADIDSDSRGVVAADFDRDGRVDLLVLSVGGGPLRLFYNRLETGGRTIRLELVGAGGNVAAIGSRVIVEAGGRQIVRDRFSHNGGVGQAPPELLIGVGDAERIDRLTVRWPNGETRTFSDLPVDSRIEIAQGEATPRVERRVSGK